MKKMLLLVVGLILVGCTSVTEVYPDRDYPVVYDDYDDGHDEVIEILPDDGYVEIMDY